MKKSVNKEVMVMPGTAMISKTILIPFACLVAGLVMGRLLPRAKPETQVAEFASEPASKSRSILSMADVRQEFAPSHQRTKARSENAAKNLDPDERILFPVGLLRDISRAGGARSPGQPLFVPNDPVCRALRITDPEKAAIQTAWDNMLRNVRELEAKSVKSAMIDEWSVRLTVPDLSKSMAASAGKFRSETRTVLGDDRSGVFLAAKQVDAAFEPSPGERSVVVTTEEIGNGRWRYRMTLEGPEEKRVWVGENIPDEIRHLTEASGMMPGLKP